MALLVFLIFYTFQTLQVLLREAGTEASPAPVAADMLIAAILAAQADQDAQKVLTKAAKVANDFASTPGSKVSSDPDSTDAPGGAPTTGSGGVGSGDLVYTPQLVRSFRSPVL